MRLKIQSANKQSVRQVAKEAGRMADHVERLRYLRSMVTVAPGKPWRIPFWWHGIAVWIIAAAVGAVGVVLVLWRKS